MEPGAGGEPAGACPGNSAQALPRHRLSLAAVRLAAEPGMDGKRSTEHVLLPPCWTFHLHCPSSARAWHRQRHRQTGSFGAGRAALPGWKDVQNPQASSPAASRGRGQPSVMASFSCKHGKALLPVSGFTMKVMAGHVGVLLHFVHGPQPLWHLQENQTAGGS